MNVERRTSRVERLGHVSSVEGRTQDEEGRYLSNVESRESNMECRRRVKARFRFQKLEVWQSARQLSHRIYQLPRSFPPEEQFGLTSQLRRAAVSVVLNIAEGSGRNRTRISRIFSNKHTVRQWKSRLSFTWPSMSTIPSLRMRTHFWRISRSSQPRLPP